MSEFLIAIALVCQGPDGIGKQQSQKECVAKLIRCVGWDKGVEKVASCLEKK